MSNDLVPAFSDLDFSSSDPKPRTLYSYAPLPSERSVRIIEILPETSTGTPQCKLTVINLDDDINFITLSYTWGNPCSWLVKDEKQPVKRDCRIICDDCQLNVTRNLYDFLKRAAAGRPESWLKPGNKMWIDAISINQADLNERSAQVRLMSEIYMMATAVYIWLGDGDDEEIQKAIDIMKRISALSDEERYTLKRVRIEDPRMTELLGECGGSWDHWKAIKYMASRSWFDRVWVIQEIAFAQRALVFCGGHCVSWEKCISACSFLDYSVVNNLQMLDWTLLPGVHADILGNFNPQNQMVLWSVLTQTRSFQSSDPRDKIFAILGLAVLGPSMSPMTEIIHVNYELGPAKIFQEVVRAMVKYDNDLNFLTIVEDPWFRNIANMPTWVPDFSTTEYPKIYSQGQRYDAGRDLQSTPIFAEDPHLLCIGAYKIGEIVETTCPSQREELIESCSEFLSLLSELSSTYITGEDRLEALWRTLIQNGFNWVSPAPEDTAKCFRDFLLFSIAKTAIYSDKSDSVSTLVESVIGQCEMYSKNDPTGLMPSKKDIENAMRKLEELAGKTSDNAPAGSQRDKNFDDESIESAAKYRLEFQYYQHMPLFRTDNGLLGLGSQSLEKGHSLWVVPGVWLPITFKSTDKANYFEVIGPAFVHGIMYGEALDWKGLDNRIIVLQ